MYKRIGNQLCSTSASTCIHTKPPHLLPYQVYCFKDPSRVGRIDDLVTFATMVHSKSSMGVALHDGQGAQCFQGESIRMLEENGGATLDPSRKGDL